MSQASTQQLVAAQGASVELLARQARAAARVNTGNFTAWYDDAAVAELGARVAGQIQPVQRAVAAATDAFAARVASQIKGGILKPAGPVDVAGLRASTTLPQVYARLGPAYRYAVSKGAKPERALKLVVDRSVAMASTDVQLAQRAQWHRFMRGQRVDGYRRVIHPELARGGTCGLCVAASDRVYHVDTLLPIHDGCVLGDSVVAADGVLAVTRRDYAGPVVVLTTASGQKLRVTANHPVLTDQGWVPAGLVDVGGQVVRHRLGQGVVGRGPHEGQRPASIEQVWRAATVDHGLHPVAVPLAAENFHGDGGYGKVDVVATSSLFAHVGDASFGEPSSYAPLVPGHGRGPLLPGQRGSHESFLGLRPRAGGGVRGFREAMTLLTGAADVARDLGVGGSPDLAAVLLEATTDYVAAHFVVGGQRELRAAGAVLLDDLLDRQSVPASPRFDPAGFQYAGQGRHAYAELGRDLRDRLAGDVELDCVVDKVWVEGPHVVYNLQTAEGWYSADNVIVSNCHCGVLPIINGVDVGLRLNKDDLARLYEEAGSTGADDLKRTQWVIHHHGELGPILANKDDAWRGPAAVAAA